MKNFKVSCFTSPAPLRLEEDGKVILILDYLNPQEKTRCGKVNFCFDVGDTGEALFNDHRKPTASIPEESGWAISSVSKPLTGTVHTRQFELENRSGSTLNDRLAITVEGHVNSALGSASVLFCVNGDDEEKMEMEEIITHKEAAQFYLRSFITRADAASVPVTHFKRNEPIHFSWESNGTNYKLYNGREDESGKPNLVYNGPNKSLTYGPGLERDATFVLVAEYADRIDKHELIEHITVTIENQNLFLSNARIDEHLDVEEAAVHGRFEVKEISIAKDIRIGGNLTAKAAAAVEGKLTSKEISASNITVNGGVAAESVTVKEKLAAKRILASEKVTARAYERYNCIVGICVYASSSCIKGVAFEYRDGSKTQIGKITDPGKHFTLTNEVIVSVTASVYEISSASVLPHEFMCRICFKTAANKEYIHQISEYNPRVSYSKTRSAPKDQFIYQFRGTCDEYGYLFDLDIAETRDII